MANQKTDNDTRVRRGPSRRTYTSHGKPHTLEPLTRWSGLRGRELDTESIRQRIKNETPYNDVYMRGLVAEPQEKK